MYNCAIPDQLILRKTYEAYAQVRILITRDIESILEEKLKFLSSHPIVKGRVKEFESYYKKYIRLLQKDPLCSQDLGITDVIGIRIVCPFFEDLAVVERCLKTNFEVIEIERKGSNYSFKEFGYESIHFLIKIPEPLIKKRGNCGLDVVEIQIRTILQDAWAEVEHELVYKATFTPFDEPMKRKLAALNASLSLADTIFQEVRTYQRQLNRELEKRRNSFFKKIEASIDTPLLTKEQSKKPSQNRQRETAIDKIQIDASAPDAVDSLENNSIDELLLKALHAHNEHRFTVAIDLYTSILKMEPENTIASLIYKHRGMANFAQSCYEDAIQDFTCSLELDRESYKAVYFRGIVKTVLLQYLEAIDDFTLSLKINPYQAFCHYRRGQAYYHLDDFLKALADCEAALILEPDSKPISRFKKLLLNKLNM
ncbi:MAG: tetratricopeptide repeat protein [Treponema sp.]|jgi:putative GTP pyrophosphokinase|nr:tetratricopeptide repeat protein [Treponema sp.]